MRVVSVQAHVICASTLFDTCPAHKLALTYKDLLPKGVVEKLALDVSCVVALPQQIVYGKNESVQRVCVRQASLPVNSAWEGCRKVWEV